MLQNLYLSLLASAAIVTSSFAADTPSAPPKFSEPRSSAATFVGSINFSIGRLGSTCAPILGESGGFAKSLAEMWQSQNAIYYTTSINYFTELSVNILDTKGAESYSFFQETIRREFEKTGNSFVDNKIVGSKKKKIESCKNLIEKVKSGGFNITETNEFASTLNEMASVFK